MSDFVLGQRWVVDSEPELGLGMVVAVEARTVTIFFPLGDGERLYSIAQAPLTRITFAQGDAVQLQSGDESTVMAVTDSNGLNIYKLADGREVPETQIGAEIELNQPFMRLMTGQIDKAKWFYFRRELDAAMSRVWNSQLAGLLGVRASLIPHQLYVAHSACEHEKVRVLLADEVGLGKTIEAGMILSRLLKQERVTRVLIAVPDALQVQWLVELVRRFSITPSLYRDEYYDFNLGQIHIIPHSALIEQRHALLEANFDLAIVDESHHLLPGTEDFEVLEDLAELLPHLVLVTATPEQLGFEGHFARLQLLDPAKYPNHKALLEEEAEYANLNEAVRAMPASREQLIERYRLDGSLNNEHLIDQLLDCHGVGRVMFRNVRSSVHGFPERIAQAHVLESDDWELRFEWLSQFLLKNPDEKVLVICHEKERVQDCENYMWKKHGIDPALFHEDMNLIERDRAAAYFADEERGAQVLLCSEIGSEGRNFQFCQHLVCLDIPEHPDLLEQRIGRLDRIGQENDVKIHALIGEGSSEAVLWNWYNTVLDCVKQQNPAASSVHDELWPGVGAAIDEALQAKASEQVAELRKKILEGRDALLEMNSCRQPQADELTATIESFEASSPLDVVSMASELLNFHFEELSAGIYSIIPADNMLIASLPGVPLEGCEVTFSRDLACAREDLLYMSWDAPFITGLWEVLHHSELGSACVALLASRQLPAGKCLIEACFDVVVQAECALECLPYLKEHSVRVLAYEGSNKDLAEVLNEEALQKTLSRVDKKLARKIIQSQKEPLPAWFAQAEHFAHKKRDVLIAESVKQIEEQMTQESNRFEYLLGINPTLDNGQLAAIEAKKNRLVSAVKNQSNLQLSAIRLIVTTEP